MYVGYETSGYDSSQSLQPLHLISWPGSLYMFNLYLENRNITKELPGQKTYKRMPHFSYQVHQHFSTQSHSQHKLTTPYSDKSSPTFSILLSHFNHDVLHHHHHSLVLAVFATAAPVDLEERGSSHNRGTAGSAYSGHTGNVNSGSIGNSGGFVYNAPLSNTAGRGGFSGSGIAVAGNGNGGVNAYSGSTSDTYGRSISNSGGVVLAGFDSNTTGKGGVSSSSAAIAGSTHSKRSNGNHGQAGSAYTGSTGSVNGGSVYNSGGKVFNGAFSNTAGKGGYSISGDAYAGNGVGRGSAYSGSTGNADGGSVYNSGDTVISGFDSNTAGKGGVSKSGNAIAGSTH
ncbi:hypothetical protein ABKN59_000133 [Abortiporus biennis]